MFETTVHCAIEPRFAALKRWIVPSSALLVALGVLGAGPTPASAAEGPGKGRQITACTSMSIEGLFREMIALKGFEQLGYKIDLPSMLTVPAAHQATATGDCTYAFDHWVPMHNPFFDPIKSMALRIGPAVAGAAQGYLIDRKTADPAPSGPSPAWSNRKCSRIWIARAPMAGQRFTVRAIFALHADGNGLA